MSQPPYLNPDRVFPAEMPAPGNSLSVTDVERLAKAGVAIKFEDIRYQIQPDHEKPVVRTLIDAFWERWKRAHIDNLSQYDGFMMPYQIAAVTYGEKVYVFVAPRNHEPFVLQDDRHLYPSDALMASVALFEKTNP